MGCLKRLIAIFLGCSCIVSFINVVNSEQRDEVDHFLDFFKEDEDWKEVVSPDESRSYSESFPQQQFDNERPYPPKRRLRKRKRRPVTTTTESAESYEEYHRDTLKESRRKITTLQDPWDEMLKEPQVPYSKRRKNPPLFETEHFDPILTASLKFDGENNKSQETTDKTMAIKTLLKQSGKVSLSEILQKKNLTLTELLKGNRQAISALTSTTEHNEMLVESQKIVQEHIKFEPPKIQDKIKKGTIDRNFDPEDHSTEVFIEKDAIKELSTRTYNSMYTGITKFEVITEPTTEKRIFVPSHPQLYTAVNYKNQPSLTEVSSTFKPKVTSTKKVLTTTKSKRITTLNQLPITNAKLNKRIQLKDTFPQETREVIETSLPANAIKIDITEIFGYKIKNFKSKSEKNDIPNTLDTPLRFDLDVEAPNINITTTMKTPTATNAKTTPSSLTTSTKFTTTKKPEVKTTQRIEKPPNKYKPLTPRDEIIQIIKDPQQKDSLMSVLERRNMTLEELIDQRNRGSSHTHLADIFHNKIKEPEPSGETYVGHMEMPKKYSSQERKQKSFLNNSEIISTSTTTTIKPVTVPQKVFVTSFPAVKIEMKKEHPIVKIEKIIVPDSIQFTKSKEEDRIILLDNNFLEDNSPVHNLDSKLYIPSEPLYSDEEMLINIPSGVKSAILASFAIIGLSIFVFLSILVVFRCNQKRKIKLNYCESFGFKKSTTTSPIIKVPNKKIKTFVNETLSKNKNPYESYMHTSMDNLWESKLRNNF